MDIIAYSPIPVEKFNISWMPCCQKANYDRCHDKKDSSSICKFSTTANKEQCRQIVISITVTVKETKE